MFFMYNNGTRARLLADNLNICRISLESEILKSRGRNRSAIGVNWGCTRLDSRLSDLYNRSIGSRVTRYKARMLQPYISQDATILNRDNSICISKVRSFQAFDTQNVPHPRLFANAQEARDSNRRFMGRTDFLSEGRGITVYEPGQQPQRHDFYVEVINVRQEFRIHVAGGNAIFLQKKLRGDLEGIVANHDHGVIFQAIPEQEFIERYGERTSQNLIDTAVRAVQACNLDFGAVDLARETGTNNIFVFEVNSAPGLTTDATFQAYLQYFRERIVNV